MRWAGAYMTGYLMLIAAILLSLWKTGYLAKVEPFWIGVGLLVVVGLGLMVSVAYSGKREVIEVDQR